MHTGITPYNSVAAGCTQAASLSKCMLYDIVEHMHYMYIDQPIYTYIDDIAQEIFGTSEEEVVSKALQVAKTFTIIVKARNLNLSSKSITVASIASPRNKIESKVQNNHIQIKQAVVARDLGVANSAGSRRCVSLAMSRLA